MGRFQGVYGGSKTCLATEAQIRFGKKFGLKLDGLPGYRASLMLQEAQKEVNIRLVAEKSLDEGKRVQFKPAMPKYELADRNGVPGRIIRIHPEDSTLDLTLERSIERGRNRTHVERVCPENVEVIPENK